MKMLAQNPETAEEALLLMSTLNKRDRAAERRQMFGTSAKPHLAAQQREQEKERREREAREREAQIVAEARTMPPWSHRSFPLGRRCLSRGRGCRSDATAIGTRTHPSCSTRKNTLA